MLRAKVPRRTSGAPNCGEVCFSVGGDGEKSYITGEYRRFIREYIYDDDRFGVSRESVLFGFRETGRLPDSDAGAPPVIPEDTGALSDGELEELFATCASYPFAGSVLRRIRDIRPAFPENREEREAFLGSLRSQDRLHILEPEEFGADETLGACHAVEFAYVFNVAQETIYTGGKYNEALADAVQEMWVDFARTGDPSAAGYEWTPYTAETRATMILGDEIRMGADLKPEQRELIAPLLHHYFNGCYMQLSMNVPHVYLYGAPAILPVMLIAGALIAVKKRGKRKHDEKGTKT